MALANLPLDQSPAVKVLAVSKNRAATLIRQVYQAGIQAFGENYLQESLNKMPQLADLNIEWHFIGRLQTNKCAKIAQHYSWVHTVENFQQAQLLDRARKGMDYPLNICLQVNLDPHKMQGVPLAEILPLAQQVMTLPHLRLRGLMTILALHLSDEEKRQHYCAIRLVGEKLINTGLTLDTFSMGMSDDYLIAVSAGSTLVRLGRIIFQENRCPENGDCHV